VTAREFVQMYMEIFGIAEKEALYLLDWYLEYRDDAEFTCYSEFPDADLPEGFLKDADEPANFEKWVENILKQIKTI